jgi:hypothetical protein
LLPSINELYRFLKTSPTDLSLTEEKLQPSGVPLYDYVIASFFDKEAMIKKLAEKEVDIRVQYQTMYGIDKSIDNIPVDSVFAMQARHFFDNYRPENTGDNEQLSRRYVVGYIIAGNYYPILDICMNESKRFVYMMPILCFDQEKGKLIRDFVHRHQRRP